MVRSKYLNSVWSQMCINFSGSPLYEEFLGIICRARSHENTYYITPKKKTKTRGIDTQKWTLAFICYARFWRAYDTQFSRAYDTKFVGVHMIRSFRVHMIRIYTTTLTLPIA